MKKYLFSSIFLISTSLMTTNTASAQQVIPLYEDGIPNSIPSPDEETSEMGEDSILRIAKVSRPSLAVYLPKEKKTSAAVIICPGGGYWILAAGHEGADVARRFNEMGITAFVLKYRIPD